MSIVGTVIFVILFTITLNFLFKKYNILIDQVNISKHKNFIQNKKTPLSGGLVIFLTLFYFLPESYKYFTIIMFIIFLSGLLSDLNILHVPLFRIFFQTIVVIIYLVLFDNFITSIRINFFDNLLNIFIIKLIFSIFCILILINGTNFMDGVNTLVVGYFILAFSNILYLSEINDLKLDHFLVTICILVLFLIYLFNFFGLMFLGDSGSYLISFIAGVTMINFFNNNDLVSPYYIAAILWYPAYENLFSIIRKLIFKKSPSNPDNEHLHQLIYIFLKKNIKKNNFFSNSLTGILICIYNLIYFNLIFNYFSNTKILVFSILFNVTLYNITFIFLNKFQKKLIL